MSTQPWGSTIFYGISILREAAALDPVGQVAGRIPIPQQDQVVDSQVRGRGAARQSPGAVPSVDWGQEGLLPPAQLERAAAVMRARPPLTAGGPGRPTTGGRDAGAEPPSRLRG